jgi:carboxymethylenebutenolidase
MLMDGAGIREGLRQNARTLAAQGYIVALPNLYHRAAGDGPTGDLTDMARITELNNRLTPQDVTGDVESCIRFAEPRRCGGVGLIGYCMGGRLSITVAQALGERIAAVVSLHPGYLSTRSPNSPDRHLDAFRARLYLATPEHDEHLSKSAFARFKQALAAHKIDFEAEIIAGAEHGFGVPGRAHFHPQGADHCWTKAFGLFAQTLPGQADAPAGR